MVALNGASAVPITVRIAVMYALSDAADKTGIGPTLATGVARSKTLA